MTTEPKRTSFMRYARVNEILNGDHALKRRLSKETTAVCRPDQTHEDFPVEVVYVTDEIHKQGIDAYTMPKIEVIRFAHRLLVLNPQPIPKPVPATAPNPTPKAAQPKSRAAKGKVPKEPKPPKEKAAAPKRKAAPKAKATAEASPAAVAAEKSGDMVTVKAPPAFIRPCVPFVPGCAILSNLQAAITVLEPFIANGDSDAKELSQKLNDLIDDVHRRTVLPNAEKELANATTTG